MFTIALIVVAAVVYFALLGLTLAFLAGATRASDHWEHVVAQRASELRRTTRFPNFRRAA